MECCRHSSYFPRDGGKRRRKSEGKIHGREKGGTLALWTFVIDTRTLAPLNAPHWITSTAYHNSPAHHDHRPRVYKFLRTESDKNNNKWKASQKEREGKKTMTMMKRKQRVEKNTTQPNISPFISRVYIFDVQTAPDGEWPKNIFPQKRQINIYFIPMATFLA